MGMSKTWTLILLMFVGAAAGFLSWFADFDRHRTFSRDGVSTMATPVAKSQKPGRSIVVFEDSRQEFPVRFKTESGQDVATMAYVPASFLQQVQKDGAGELVYMRDEPTRLIFPGDLERMPKSHGWLLFGVVSLVLGILGIMFRGHIMGMGLRQEEE